MECLDEIIVFAYGTPKQQGSVKTWFNPVTQMSRVWWSTKGLGKWRSSIKAALREIDPQSMFMEGCEDSAYEVTAVFFFTKPKSYKRFLFYRHTTFPDLDKLVRALFDELSEHVVGDDKRVFSLSARKEYVDVGSASNEEGVFISVRRLPRTIDRRVK